MAQRDPTLHVSLRWLRDYLYNQTEAGRVLILLDCCYSGYLVNSAADPNHDLIRRLYVELFEATPQSGRVKKLGFRRALTATGPDTRIVLWLNDQVFLRADTGGWNFRPYFYQLRIENSGKLS